ncbi:MAG: ABC transporter substrate-binding protein [Bacilli bacterium]|nr:ABC transporter substrate-binding protein [Bacilli bacterium]
MKKIRILAVLSAFALASLASCGGNQKTIAIVQLMTHTSLDEINEAIVKTLEGSDVYRNSGYSLVQENPEGDMSILSQTMAKLNETADIVVAIATPVAQTAYNKLSSDKSIVFAACSDPIGSGIVRNLEKPGENITGTSDAIQVKSIIDKALLIDPDLDELGFIYNPMEANSVANKVKIEDYCKEKNISLISSMISNSKEMSEVANVLSNKVDAIFVTDDNTVASSMPSLVAATKKAGIPCYTGVESMVRDGGMYCLGINYGELGKKTGEMVLDILSGTKAGDIPVKIFDDNLNSYLNIDYINETGIKIPSSIMDDPYLVKISGDK